MEPFIYGIDELTASAIDYFINKQRLSTGTLEKYKRGWGKLKCFMNLQNLTDYSFAVGESYIQSELGAYNYSTLSTPQKHFLRCINALTDFQQMGSVLVKRKNAEVEFEGAIGKIMTDLVNRNINLGFSKSTTKSYKCHLHRFLAYLTANNIRLLDTINISHIIAFIKSYGNDKSSIKHSMLAIIRVCP
jgi:hypothetical protein